MPDPARNGMMEVVSPNAKEFVLAEGAVVPATEF